MANMGTAQSILDDETGTGDDFDKAKDVTPPATPETPAPEASTPAPAAAAPATPPAPVAAEAPPAPAPAKAPDVPSGFVPHAALHEERLRSRELKLKLDEVTQKLGVVDVLRQQLDEYRKAGKTSENTDPAPSKEEDPIAYLEWENRQMRRDLDTIINRDKNAEANTEQQAKVQKQFQEMTHTVQEQVNDYIKIQPDYPQAFQYVVQQRLSDFKAMGITDPTEAAQMLDREILQMAATALHKRINPGEAAYNLAVARGYKPATPTPPATPPAGAPNSLSEQLDRLEKGSRAGSMGAGGVAPENNLDLAAIDGMSDAEFDAFWAKQFGSNSIY